jgi:hypothetical protein
VNNAGPGKPPGHGTDRGYGYHMRWDKPPCPECREAHRLTMAAWRAKGVICKDCGKERPRAAAGRCGWCYTKHHQRKARKK